MEQSSIAQRRVGAVPPRRGSTPTPRPNPREYGYIAMCRLIQYRKEGCIAPLFPVRHQLAQRNMMNEETL